MPMTKTAALLLLTLAACSHRETDDKLAQRRAFPAQINEVLQKNGDDSRFEVTGADGRTLRLNSSKPCTPVSMQLSAKLRADGFRRVECWDGVKLFTDGESEKEK